MDGHNFIYYYLKIIVWKKLLEYSNVLTTIWNCCVINSNVCSWVFVTFCGKRKTHFFCSSKWKPFWLKVYFGIQYSKHVASTASQDLKCSSLNKTQTLMSHFTFPQRQETAEGQVLQQWVFMRKVSGKAELARTVSKWVSSKKSALDGHLWDKRDDWKKGPKGSESQVGQRRGVTVLTTGWKGKLVTMG